jgi:hypothetical protein
MATGIKVAVSALSIAAGITYTIKETMKLSKTLGAAALTTVALSAVVAVPAFASTTPVQGVGVQLTDTQLINFPTNHVSPWQPEPDTYIGTKDQGTKPDPIKPGTSRAYHVAISNTGNIRETMAAFPAAAKMSAAGVFSYASVSPASTDAASSWTTVSPASAVLAPGASYTATVTVTVPAAAKAGSYYAAVWAGPKAQTAKPGSITLAIYAGVREYLTVS